MSYRLGLPCQRCGTIITDKKYANFCDDCRYLKSLGRRDHGPGFWTTERWALVEYLAEEGLSASAIAEKVGGVCTKNMVIGRLHRQHGPGVLAIRRGPRIRIPTLEERLVDNDPGGCRYIAGDPLVSRDWCGREVVTLRNRSGVVRSWCAEHAAIVYQHAPKAPIKLPRGANSISITRY